MTAFKVTYSTMGVSTPASVAEGTRYYRYNGDQPAKKEPQSEPLPQNVKATTAKQKRFARYCELRLKGVGKDEAAREIVISSSTANYYERDFQHQQQQGGTA